MSIRILPQIFTFLAAHYTVIMEYTADTCYYTRSGVTDVNYLQSSKLSIKCGFVAGNLRSKRRAGLAKLDQKRRSSVVSNYDKLSNFYIHQHSINQPRNSAGYIERHSQQRMQLKFVHIHRNQPIRR